PRSTSARRPRHRRHMRSRPCQGPWRRRGLRRGRRGRRSPRRRRDRPGPGQGRAGGCGARGAGAGNAGAWTWKDSGSLGSAPRGRQPRTEAAAAAGVSSSNRRRAPALITDRAWSAAGPTATAAAGTIATIAALRRHRGDPMKLGSLKEGGRDGTLVVVSRDLSRGVRAAGIAPTLQRALEDWSNTAPRLNALAQSLEGGDADGAFDLDVQALAAPLP